ncbi:MAG: phage tail protein [Nitrospiraceae bacterium]
MSIGQVAQVGLGAVGFMFGGTTGAAIGWMVGGWLFSDSSDKGNEIIDPGAQELPGINQALRGVTMPVLFGTNRCESYHTWRKNFEAIRNESKDESGAGGKAGGSGGGGKGGAQGAGGSVSYTYKLDAMYHIGITDGEYFMYGGWIGNQRLNDQTILGISQGFGNGGVLFGRSETTPKEATVQYDEAYYYPGGELSPGWTYFLNQESIAVTDAASLGMRWKHMAWVGFRGLDLGDSPGTPALQFEIGPGGGEISLEDVNYGNASAPEGGDNLSATGTKDGRWFTGTGPSFDLNYINDDGTITQRTGVSADLFVMMSNMGITNGESSFHIGESSGVVPGTNLVLIKGHLDSGGIGNKHGFALLDLTDIDGSVTDPWDNLAFDGSGMLVGGAFIAADNTKYKSAVILGFGLSGEQADVGETFASHIMMVFDNPVQFDSIHVMCLPTITQFKAVVNETASNSFALRTAAMPSSIGINFPEAAGQHSSSNAQIFWFGPHLRISLGADWDSYMYCYLSRDIVNSSTNAYIVANRDDHPDGWVVRWDYGIRDGLTAIKPVFGALEVVNAKFKDGGVISMGPGDEQQGRDGGVTTNAQYRPEVHIHKWAGAEAAGGYLVLMHKLFYGSIEAAPFGTHCKVVAYIYNPLADTFTKFGEAESPIFDTVADAGQSEGQRYAWSASFSTVTYSEETKVIRYIGKWKAGGGDPLDDEFVTAEFGTLDIGGATDVTPAFIIHEILTDPTYGMGYSEDNIDATSFGLAVQYCTTEEILVSTKYRREQGYMQIIDQLLSLYNGYLIRRGDTIIFGLMDFGSVSQANPVRTLDNDHFVVEKGDPPIQVTEGAQQDTYNRIKVNYLDRGLEYRQNFVEENDEVDQDLRGIRAKEFPAQFVMSEQTARKMAIRGLWSNLYARDAYRFNLGWKDMDLEPGDLVTLVDSFDTKLAGGVRARLTTMEEVEPGNWKCAATQELEFVVTAQPLVNSSTNATAGGFERGPTGEAHQFSMYELPKEFQGANMVLYTGWAQSEKTMGAKLWISGDNTTFSIASDITPHTISGILAEPLPMRPRGFVETDVDVYLFPDVRSAAFNVASPSFVETFTLEDGGETQRALGGTAMWVGSEMVAYQNPIIVGSNHYRFEKVYRGWGGTPIAAQSSGDFWWRHGGGVFTQVFNEDKIGTKIFYKVTPYNFSGFIWPVESVDAQEYTIQGTYLRPQIPANLHIWVDSQDYTQTTKQGLSDITSLHFKAEWEDSTRCEGYGTLGFGFGGYGHFATDVLSHNWRVEVVGSGDLVVHSVSVSTPFFVYSADQNFNDNGAFRPNVTFKVTPYGTFGDALITEVVSLEFFGA